MMFGAPKKCARCDKQVYSIEELKCLDKVWHKGCFKCTICNTTLNLKNYKGMDKMPYCVVHYPKQQHTVVSDNPELLRIKQNTEIQSQAKYHADYERSKGSFTVVADDPEMKRVLENTKNISNIKYHEDFEKSRANYKPNNNKSQTNIIAANITNTPSSNSTLIASYRSGEEKLIEQNVRSQQQRRIGSIADYDPFNGEKVVEKSPIVDQNNNNINLSKQYQAMQQQLNQQKLLLQQQQQKQMNNGAGAQNGNYRTTNSNKNNQRIEYVHADADVSNLNSTNGHRNSMNNNSSYSSHYDTNNVNNSTGTSYQAVQTSVFKAIYDYDAKEEDEISFRDGDKFINCEQIDVGWMIGVHEKTGKHGMIPYNYTEPIDLF